ncbi:helix-turn-helix transcriptional regulator [Kibdelosporangium aridum]|uniref:Helix-turn-helix transcriptional regulator n=1 Tax=Kibdelosporangium aridum TaxID=2030 RepID=A0A428Z0D4_KIBAR|nr:AAA family ATPase [Kibdelosporangium aridum]RSM77627.1 helix-turn-helix transcriptional regulator [Kibdelosporangium aridum]
MEPRLTGRDRETATLAGILADAEHGTGRLVLISGEPGIGKTRLAEHASRAARDLGFAVLEGQADPLQTGLAYAPIVSALRTHLDSLPAQTSTEMLHSLPDLGRLITDPRLPHPAPGGDPALNRTHMFEAVLRFLQLNAPLLLIVDDLHWADDGTIELVHYLGRGTSHGQFVVLGTCRTPQSGQRLTDLATLVRRNGTELVLQPLNDSDLADLLRELLGQPPHQDLLAEMSARTKGVPLFVRALAPVLPGQGPLPAIVRDVVLSRLHALDEPERAILDLIAVAGTSATADVLGVDTADPALRTLLKQGHIEEHIAGRELTYRVAHPLYAEVAYAELTESERRRLHARLATAIGSDNVLAAAPHYRGAGELVDTQRAIDIFTAAGRRALDVVAAPEAVEYFSRALHLARGARPDQVPKLLDNVGLAYQGVGDLDAATGVWLERLAIAEADSDMDRQAALRVQLAILESERGNPQTADEHVTARMSLTGNQDVQSAALRVTIAARHWDPDRIRALFDQVDTTFRDDPRPEAQSMLHCVIGFRAAFAGDFGAAHQSLLIASRHSDQASDDAGMIVPFNPLRMHIGVCVLLGQIPEARELADFDTKNSATFVLPSATYSLRMVRTTLLYFTGDLRGAVAALDQDLVDVAALGLNRMHARMLAHKAHLLAELGQTEEASRCVEQAQQWRKVHENALEHGLQTANAAIALASGHPERAPDMNAIGFTIREPLISTLRNLVAAQTAIAANDLATARTIRDVLRKSGRTAPLLDALADRFTGLMTKDNELLVRTARRFEEMGAPLLAAQTAFEAAEIVPGLDVIGKCLEYFQQSGVTPWIDRARRLARAHGVAQPARKADGVLSKREAEIVRFVGQGLSNADIATRLFLSTRTVETHLRNSYRKLDITSRLRLAQWAAKHEDEL